MFTLAMLPNGISLVFRASKWCRLAPFTFSGGNAVTCSLLLFPTPLVPAPLRSLFNTILVST